MSSAQPWNRRMIIEAGTDAARMRARAPPAPLKRTMWRPPVEYVDDREGSDSEESSDGRRPVRFVQPVSLSRSHAQFLSDRDEEIIRDRRRAALEEQRNRAADADEVVEDFGMGSEYDRDLAWRLAEKKQSKR